MQARIAGHFATLELGRIIMGLACVRGCHALRFALGIVRRT